MPSRPAHPLRYRMRGWLGSFRAPTRHEWRRVQAARRLADELRGVSQLQLAARLAELRDRVQSGISPQSDDVLPPVFGLVSEAIRRTLGITPYDVQLVAGLVLAEGSIAEMQTGEGKTLAAVFPAVLHALRDRGVHVMTANDYLAARDAAYLAPVMSCLGLSVGVIQPGSMPDEKRRAYSCDITYGPGHQFGFDYLQDQLLLAGQCRQPLGSRLSRLLHGESEVAPLQRGLACAIIDEADGVLLDEATTPLIIAEPGAAGCDALVRSALQTAATLVRGEDFNIDIATQQVRLTDCGAARAQAKLAADDRAGLQCTWREYVVHALYARHCLTRNVHYIVRDGAVHLVDVYTGRVLPGRAWQQGMHQAVEAKEGLTQSQPRRAIARISRQRLAGLYDRLCGLTGTALGSQRELWQVYGLPVVTIPTHRSCRRITLPPRFFACADARHQAVAEAIRELLATERPVLVGTRTIADSELLAGRLEGLGIPFQLLNGKQDAEEAQIVARAGERGSVTVATNMAGRGTDIRLGPGIAEQGGLHVIAVEPHESLRVDRQLAGRAGRQGDPGSWQQFISAEDQLITAHASGLSKRIAAAAHGRGEATGNYSSEVRRAQRQAERLASSQRKALLGYDNWRNELSEALVS